MTAELGLEPLDGVLLAKLVLVANASLLVLLARRAESRATKNDEEIHTVDTGGRIILQTQVDVLVDAEAKVACLTEVLVLQLVFLDLKTLVEDLFGLGTADSDVGRDLLISADTEGTHGQTSCGQQSRSNVA